MKKIILFYILIQSVVFAFDVDSLTPDSKIYAKTILKEDSSNMALVEELYNNHLLPEFGRVAIEYNRNNKEDFSMKEKIYLFKFANKLPNKWDMRAFLLAGPYYIKINNKIYESASEIDLDSVSISDDIYLFQKKRFDDREKFLKVFELGIENKFSNIEIENLYFDIQDNFDEIKNDIKSGTYQNYYKEEYDKITSEDSSKSYSLYKKLISKNYYKKGDIRTILSLKTDKDKLKLFDEVENMNVEDKPYQLKKLIKQR